MTPLAGCSAPCASGPNPGATTRSAARIAMKQAFMVISRTEALRNRPQHHATQVHHGLARPGARLDGERDSAGRQLHVADRALDQVLKVARLLDGEQERLTGDLDADLGAAVVGTAALLHFQLIVARRRDVELPV